MHAFVGTVTISPSNVQAKRVGDTIELSWDSVSLEEAEGFFVYGIKVIPGVASRERSFSVAFNVTSVNITDTESQLAYTVSISVLLLSDAGLVEGPAVDTYLTS